MTDAVPTQLGPVVRALSKVSPWAEDDEGVLEVCLRAEELLTIKPGSRVLLRVRSEDLEWLNLHRPIFADRELGAVLWLDKPSLDAFVRRAVDLFDWVSRVVPVPAKPLPDFAIDGVRTAIEIGDSFVWTGERLHEVLRAAGMAALVELDARTPAWELVRTVAAPNLPIFQGLRSDHDAWRIRMVMALAGREGAWVAHDPENSLAGMWQLNAQMADWDIATERLRDAGYKHPGLLAAWLDLEQQAIEWFAAHPRSTLDDREGADVASGSAPAWMLRRYGREAATRVARALLRTSIEGPPEDPSLQAIWSCGAAAWEAAQGGAPAPRLVRALRVLGDAVPSIDLSGAVEEAGFDDVATALRLRRWDQGADQRAELLVEGLIARGQTAHAFVITNDWITCAAANGDDRSLAAAKLRLGDIHRMWGETERARRCFEASLAVLRTASLDQLQDVDDQLLHSAVLRKLGEAHAELSELAAALDCLTRSQKLAQILAEREPDLPAVQGELLLALRALGDVHRLLGDSNHALSYLQDSLRIARTIVERSPNADGGASWALATGLSSLGDVHRELGAVDLARRCLEDSLAIFRNLGVRQPDRFDLTLDHAIASKQLGLVYEALDRIEDASRSYQDALVLLQALDQPARRHPKLDRELGSVLDGLGRCNERVDIRKAIDFYEQALASKRKLGAAGQALAHGNLGSSYRRMGDIAKAIDHHARALAIYEDLGDPQGQANAHGDLGQCYWTMGDITKAINHHSRALAIYEEVQNLEGQARAHGNLGGCYWRTGDIADAITHLSRALAINEEIHNLAGQALNLSNLSGCHGTLGEVTKAIEYGERALAIDEKLGRLWAQATDLANLGSCYGTLGDVNLAIEHYERALAIEEKLGRLVGQAAALRNLGICYWRSGNIPAAINYLERALAINEKLGRSEDQSDILRDLGLCYRTLGDIPKAIGHYERALASSKRLGDLDGQAEALGGLSQCYRVMGDRSSAHDYEQRQTKLDAQRDHSQTGNRRR